MNQVFTEIIQPTWSTLIPDLINPTNHHTFAMIIPQIEPQVITEAVTQDRVYFVHAPPIDQARAALHALNNIIEPQRSRAGLVKIYSPTATYLRLSERHDAAQNETPEPGARKGRVGRRRKRQGRAEAKWGRVRSPDSSADGRQ